MTSPQEDLIPTLKSYLFNWKWYVDNTYAHVEPTKVKFILNKINNYHSSINFTFELGKNNEINFLNILIKRLTKLETGIYRKPTNTNIYINYNAHAPTEGKIEIIRNLIKRAKFICSDESLVNEEMKYLTKVFHKINNSPMSIIYKITQQEFKDG